MSEFSNYRLSQNPQAVEDYDLFEAAANIGLAGAGEIAHTLHQTAGDLGAALEIFDGWANAKTHSNPDLFSKWFAVRNAVRFLQKDDPSAPDKFGFRASTRRESILALGAAGLIK